MGITGAEISIPTMTVQVAAISTEETASVAPAWAAEATDDRWEPLQIRMGANGELSTLTLRRILGASYGQAAEEPEDAGTLHGKRVRLVDDSANEWFAGYTGQDSLLIQADPQHEDVRVTVYGPDWRLSQKVVSRQFHITEDVEDEIYPDTHSISDYRRSETYQSDLPIVFNPVGVDKDGLRRPLGNMFDDDFSWSLGTTYNDAERGCAVFDAPGRKAAKFGDNPVFEAELWTAHKALRSLVEYFDDGDVISNTHTEWNAIKTKLGATTTIGEVDVEGMNLLEAIRAILLPLGFGFSVTPYSDDNNGSFAHKLHVENLRNAGTKIALDLGQKGYGVTDAYGASEIKRLDFLRDGHNIRNEVTVIGSPTMVQVEFEYDPEHSIQDLRPLWKTGWDDLGDYDTDNVIDPRNGSVDWETFRDKYTLKGDSHKEYRHVFRSFALNEDNAFGVLIRDGSDMPIIPDLPGDWGIGDGYDCLRRPRPIGPMLVWDDANQTIYRKPQIVLRIEAGSSNYDADISKYCDVWTDRAGITINGGLKGDFIEYDDDGLVGEVWCPFAGHTSAPTALQETSYLTLLHNAIRGAGTYRLHILVRGSIEDDTCVKSTATKQASRAMPLLAQHVVRMGQFRKVRTADDLDGTEDTRDDSTACAAYATALRNAMEDELGIGSIMVPFVTRTLDGQALRPLIGVTGTTGRVIGFDVDGGAEVNYPLIRSVVTTFGNTQVTELVLDSNLLGIS